MNGFDNEINTRSGGGTVENSSAGTTATLGVGVNDTTGPGDKDTEFDGLLQDGPGTGKLALAKLGDNVLFLTASSTYTGQTTVEDGALAVLGSISNSPVDLAGGELDGSDGNGTVTVETNLVLTSSASEINYGDSVSFTAAVSPVNSAYSGYGAPSGSVNFYDETTGVPLGTVTAFSDNGDGAYSATLPAVSGLDAEDHCILAIYSGDATFVASTSDLTTDVTVDPASTSVTVTASVGARASTGPRSPSRRASMQRMRP